MKITTFSSIIIVAAFSILVGCAHMGASHKPLSISDIKGTWEGVYFGLCLLDIRENGKGYLVFSSGSEDDEAYEIKAISFSEGTFTISLQEYGEKGELL